MIVNSNLNNIGSDYIVPNSGYTSTEKNVKLCESRNSSCYI